MHMTGMFSFSTFQHALDNLSDALLPLSGPMQWTCLCCNPSLQFSGPQPRFFNRVVSFSFSNALSHLSDAVFLLSGPAERTWMWIAISPYKFQYLKVCFCNIKIELSRSRFNALSGLPDALFPISESMQWTFLWLEFRYSFRYLQVAATMF